jgi:enoyl-CoA hydratase
MSGMERVTLERDGHVLLVGINRPEKRNAFDLAMLAQLAAAYETAADDPAVRAIVLFPHGDHTSAGLDLAEVGAFVAQHGPRALSGGKRIDPFGLWGPPSPKPVVMACAGISFTVAIELALACDIVVAADSVRFRQLEIARGIVPFGGATIRAPAKLGWGNAMKFLLTAAEFGAAEAHRIGLAQEVVPHGQHLPRAKEIAHLIAKQAPLGVQASLANARVARDRGESAAADHLVELLPGLMATEDAREGVQSFVERREASFVGR